MIMTNEFVELIPDRLEEGVIYVSMKYCTVAHKCACGCGNEVVTPLSPTDWQLAFDGESITLYPSIGNWNFDCQSHYWIVNSQIEWARKWTRQEIEAGRLRDRLNKKRGFRSFDSDDAQAGPQNDSPRKQQMSFWDRLIRWFT